MRDPNSEPYTDEELAQIQAIAERTERENAAAQKREPTRKERRTAVRAQAKRHRGEIIRMIPNQGPGFWLEEARRKRDAEGR